MTAEQSKTHCNSGEINNKLARFLALSLRCAIIQFYDKDITEQDAKALILAFERGMWDFIEEFIAQVKSTPATMVSVGKRVDGSEIMRRIHITASNKTN